MSSALVAYASKHGSTGEIVAAIAERLNARGLQASCVPTDQVDDLTPYDAVIAGDWAESVAALQP